MRRDLLAALLLPLITPFVGAAALPGSARIDADPACTAAPGATGDGMLKRTDKNTVVFDHRTLQSVSPALLVLEVDHGGYFQVVFRCTAPALFNYTVTGDPEPKPDGAAASTLNESIIVREDTLVSRGITMRHDSRFMRYRVSARLRAGAAPPTAVPEATAVAPGVPVAAAPKPPGGLAGAPGTGQPPAPPAVVLYGVEFDVWVRTAPEWKLGVIGALGFSTLVDEKFFIKTGADNKSTFEKAPGVANDRWRNDVVALANVYHERTLFGFLNAGAAFGIGTSGGSPRYFLGPSIVFGKYFVFSPGISIGSVASAPIGQAIGEAPVNGANTLNTLSSRRLVKPSLAIGFTWIDRKDQFAAALASASASGSIGSCVASVSPTELKFQDAEEKQVAVTAADDCSWVATLQKTGSGFTIKGGSGKGKGSIGVSVGAQDNTARSDVLNVVGPFGSAAKTVKLEQAKMSCIVDVNGGKPADAVGKSSITVTLNAASPCQWTASVDNAAFKIATQKGDDTIKSIAVTVPAQTDADQTATLTVVGPEGSTGKTVAIKQPKKP